MADLVDHDHTSRTHYDAVTKAAEALAARALTQQLVAGPLWEADGASLLAAAYAFHAGPDKQPPPPTSGRSSRPAQRRPMLAIKPLQATPPPSRQTMVQVRPPSRFRQHAHALPRWTPSGCPALPYST